MSIENRQNICYNEITKEVKSNEKLNFRISIFWLWWKGRKSERKNLQGKFSEKMFFDFMSKPNVKKERNKNDVRYQDRTEITLGCVGKHDQGLFHFYGMCLRRGSRLFFCFGAAVPTATGWKKWDLFATSPNTFIVSQNRALVNTAEKDLWNFSQINKKYLWAFDKMSIENHQKICYNEITKKEEVQTDENLNRQAFIKDHSDICIEHNKKAELKMKSTAV